ncbi:calcium-regulated heat stable protein 1-like [Ruditapes philippinarum]|uniref:calcium-regulated heat stable protein 1-like n=1 Tax=Ruditapes philippinarum TaxID=129788 RepID=UPI00295B24F1|nr:calcium-regulated heat stable protein 1-like [Ruditapes philippinarum]
MSSGLPDTQAANNAKISPVGSPIINKFREPSPVPTRRNRTYSQTKTVEKLRESPKVHHGIVKEFCRNKGHGFILDTETNQRVFVHVSDIEGEFVPKENDDVTFKILPLPLNPKKEQAVHVKITHLAPGVTHETWTSSPSPTLSPRS